ncbi:ATP-NAD kinase family protein [Candidatus Bathyarchaeota archaeon]|nr:ATP-NAD kinase family protein [Candidatus Bathyarchaeota archaeon]
MKPAERLPNKVLGFIVNPIAGMGGAVGLKGTDGEETLLKALGLGAKPVAPLRADIFLQALEPLKEKLTLVVGAGTMGEDEAAKREFSFRVVGERKKETKSGDTESVAKAIMTDNVDLLVFCGGDGTARDVLDAVGSRFPVLGVPTGVKMHSAVFTMDPIAASVIVARFLWEKLPLKEVEVMDVDEEAFRLGRLSAKLYGYLLAPYEPTLIQGFKMESPMTESELQNQAALALYVIEEMKPGVLYVMGPGTTTRTIADLLNEKKTLLGVDVFLNRKLAAADVNESQVLELTKGKEACIIVTPIGGQGFIFGRGNLQISPRVVRQIGLDRITVVATKSKLRGLKSLKVDTGDIELDRQLSRYTRVVTDYREEQIVKVEQ